MGAIYGSAHIVFAAHGPKLGLNKEINTCTVEDDTSNISHVGDANVFVRCIIDHANLVNPLDDTDSYFGRAWCFQERLFGSRILHFGGLWEEIWFECDVRLRCECEGVKEVEKKVQSRYNEANSAWNHQKASFSQILEKAKTLDPPEGSEKFWRLYTSLCETFSSQGLSNPQDTLLALSSLVNRMSPYLGRYFAGLWEHNILIGLQWESLDGQDSHRHSQYIAPSFSWASRTGAVVWYISDKYLTPNFQKCRYAQVIDIYCVTSPGAPFGRVTGGYIKLRGYITKMQFEDYGGCYSQGRLKILKLTGLPSEETNFSTGADFRESTSKGPDAPSRIAETIGEPSRTKPKPRFRRLLDKLTRKTPAEANKIDVRRPKARGEGCYVCMDTVEDMLEARSKIVTCLDIMRDKEGTNGFISALILLSVDGQPNTYRRVGFSTMTNDFFQDAELTSVTII